MVELSTLLSECVALLRDVSDSPRLDVEVLLMHRLGCDRLTFIRDPHLKISREDEECIRGWVSRRIAREPIAYIVGKREFWGLDFSVSPAVLVPRPETELLVELGIRFLEDIRNPRVLDLGTGSGAIAVSLAHSLKERGLPSLITATDISADALAIAQTNAERYGLTNHLQFLLSDWDKGIPNSERFHLVVTNPPYIRQGTPELPPELGYEPASALFGGDDGLDAYRSILPRLPSRVSAGGLFLAEIGWDQREAIHQLVSRAVPSVADSLTFHRDLAGHDRAFSLKF